MASATIRVGAVEVLSLADAEGSLMMAPERMVPGLDAGALEPYRRLFPEAFDEEGRWKAVIGSFLLRSGGRTLLVDTGIGPFPFGLMDGATGRLPEELTRHGVALDEVDTVFLTHMHGDHIGWNVGLDGAPTFPRARYLIHEADWRASHEAGESARPLPVTRSLTPLERFGSLELLTGETALTPEVIALPTPGHTPGHMSVLITSQGEKALISGDVLTNPAQVSEPDWVPIFDSDGAQAAQTRRTLLDRIEAEGMTLAAGHFPFPGYGRVARLEGRRLWQALA